MILYKSNNIIFNRNGFEEFKKWALKDVTLPDIAVVKENIY